MNENEPTAEELERAGRKAIRIVHLHFGWVPITEYTQEDFDHLARAAMWRAEPEDDWNPEDWTDSEDDP